MQIALRKFSRLKQMTAQLSYTDKRGYYGLRVEPSYEQMLQSLRKEVRIPQPDRSAKWYATGIYRAFLMEQAKRFNDAQRKDLEYDDSGAHLPAAADKGHHESMAGTDDTWSTVLGTRAFSSGVTHWDIRINSSSTAYVFVGVASSAADLSSFLGGCAHGYGFIGEQALYHNREKVKIYGEPFTSGDIVGVTLDLNSGTVSFSRNHKSLGIAFDRVFGELYPAVAFYNVGQELEILTDGFRTTCTFESIPVSPCRLNLDDLSVLNELALCLYRRHALSHRLLVLVAEQCNVWCTAAHVRARAVSGRDVMLATESALLSRYVSPV